MDGWMGRSLDGRAGGPTDGWVGRSFDGLMINRAWREGGGG